MNAPSLDLVASGARVVEMALRHCPDRVTEVRSTRPPEALGVELPEGVRFQPARRDQLDALVDPGVRHGGVVARVRPPPAPSSLQALAERVVAEESWLLMLDGVTDPRNLGAILRSAAWFGVPALVAPQRSTAPLSSAAVKASAGAALHVPVLRVVNLARSLDTLRAAGLWIYVAEATEAALPAREAPRNRPAVLVLGDEGRGVRPNVARRADLRVRVPGRPPGGLDSLNVSVAAGVLLHVLCQDATAAGKRT